MARTSKGGPPPTSTNLDDFRAELNHAGDPADLERRIKLLPAKLKELLDAADFELVEVGRGAKKNFAQRFSNAIAQKTANALRKHLPGIKPGADGRGQESLSKSASGLKKIDVNYSSERSGLELAISIKTINFKDDKTRRYTKNTKRVDGELRAEAEDCHTRQPYAVLVGYLFLPLQAAEDGKAGISSLKHNAQVLSARTGRDDTKNAYSRIELSFVAVYDDEGQASFFFPSDVPDNGLPTKSMTFSKTLQLVREVHAKRNRR